MDPNLLSALIGLGGGLAGVGIGAYWQRRVTHLQLCRETTLHLYDRLDDADVLEARIRADAILAANASAAQPKCLPELYATLARDEWRHISRTRHFLDQIGLLHRIGYLDPVIALPLFAAFVNYWANYFTALEALEKAYTGPHKSRVPAWRVNARELKEMFPPHP